MDGIVAATGCMVGRILKRSSAARVYGRSRDKSNTPLATMMYKYYLAQLLFFDFLATPGYAIASDLCLIYYRYY